MAEILAPAAFGHAHRAPLLRRALNLAYLTVAWNVVEGVVAVGAALAAGSVALLGFGLESFVESASGLVIVWRATAERRATDHVDVERIESLAGKLVAVSLVALALYVAYDATAALYLRERPGVSTVGIVVLALSVVVMQWLARAKRRTAVALGSRSMQADAFQTSTCFYLSVIVLAGIGLNAALGWWWADPLAALAITVPLAMEAKEAWEGDACCDAC